MDFRTICTQNDYQDISVDIMTLMAGRRWQSLIMKHLDRNEHYFNLNNLVKDIYEKHHDCKNYEELYSLMQSVQTDRKTDWGEEAFEELCEKCGDLRAGWVIDLHSKSQYWYQIDIGPRKCMSMISAIKVYVTVDGPCVKDLLIGAVEKNHQKWK